MSLQVPPTDIQIVGDGYQTSLQGTVTLLGPLSHVILRDLTVVGAGSGDGIRVQGADQAGGRVFLDHVEACCSITNILYDGLSSLTLEARDICHQSATGTSLQALGTGKFNVFSA